MEDNNKTAVQVAEDKHQQRQQIIEQLETLREAEKEWEKAERINGVNIGWERQYATNTRVTESAHGPIRAIALFYIREGIKELENDLITL